METKQVADEIIRQLGGYGRLESMTGAKNFVYGENDKNDPYVQFRIGRNDKRVNMVKVTLTANDTYWVEFLWATVKKTTVRELCYIHADQLVGVFESETGMYLYFNAGHGII